MDTSFLNTIIYYVGQKAPMQAKTLKRRLPFDDIEYVSRAEVFFNVYNNILENDNKKLTDAIDCYLKVCSDILEEQVKFIETGKYSSTSFAEVNERVYNNPEIMSYYMTGLLVSQYLWDHHYKVLQFFFRNLSNYADGIKNILEVGGGQGLFTNEVLRQFTFDYQYTMVDISDTSIEMSKSFVHSDKVTFVHSDIFKYKPEIYFDFIIMGEVLEHVEDPLALMKKLFSLGTQQAIAFITVPCNSPMIDHIYLFRNSMEIKTLFNEAGWEVINDITVSSEPKPSKIIDDPMIPVKYAAFIKKIQY